MDCPSPPGKGWYALLALPVASALLALQYHHFALKAGVAGGGILILVLLQVRSARAARDAWMILGAFLFSIGGDWFLSHRHGLPERFLAGIGLFFLAHVGYLAFSLMNGRLHRGMTLIVLAGYLALFFLKIRPSTAPFCWRPCLGIC